MKIRLKMGGVLILYNINSFHYKTGFYGFLPKGLPLQNRLLRLLFYMFNSLLFDDDHKTPVRSRLP